MGWEDEMTQNPNYAQESQIYGNELDLQQFGQNNQWSIVSPPNAKYPVYQNPLTGETHTDYSGSSPGNYGPDFPGGGYGGGGAGFGQQEFEEYVPMEAEGYGYQPYEQTAFGGPSVAAPDMYNAAGVDPGSIIDVTDLIDAESRLSDQRREQGFAAAANRFGQSGMVASTPYMGHLAGVAGDEEARKDQIFGTLRKETGMDYANRMFQGGMFNASAENEAMAQHYAAQMAASQANAANALDLYGTQEGFNYGANQQMNSLGQQDYWNQMNFNANQQAQAHELNNVMGMMGGIL